MKKFASEKHSIFQINKIKWFFTFDSENIYIIHTYTSTMAIKRIYRKKTIKPSIKRKKRIYDTQIPQTAKDISSVLNVHGATCYIVGGFTRDAVTGGSPKDVDIEVHGMDIDTISDILSQDFKVNYVGKSFGVLKVKRPGDYEDIDVSVPRRDSTGRKPDVAFIQNATPEDAASRRDFTINALMWNTKEGKMVDPYGGMRDIQSKTIRAVTPESFVDDPLRVVRAAQFASRFGYEVDPHTTSLAKQSNLGELSTERIREEMLKALTKSQKPSKFFYTMESLGQLDSVFPELAALKHIKQDEFHHPEGDVFTHTMHVLDRTPNNIYLRVAALLHDTGKVSTTTFSGAKVSAIGHEKVSADIALSFLQRFRFDNNTINMVLPVIESHMVPHNLVMSGTTITLAKKNALLARVAHGYNKIMKNPKSAFDKYNLLIMHTIADAGERAPYEVFFDMPPLSHYEPRVNVEALQERYTGKELGEAITNRYINQINSTPAMKKVLKRSVKKKTNQKIKSKRKI